MIHHLVVPFSVLALVATLGPTTAQAQNAQPGGATRSIVIQKPAAAPATTQAPPSGATRQIAVQPKPEVAPAVAAKPVVVSDAEMAALNSVVEATLTARAAAPVADPKAQAAAPPVAVAKAVSPLVAQAPAPVAKAQVAVAAPPAPVQSAPKVVAAAAPVKVVAPPAPVVKVPAPRMFASSRPRFRGYEHCR